MTPSIAVEKTPPTTTQTGPHAPVRASEPDMLSVRAGRLFVEDIAASELVERFGSPLFVYSERQLRANVRRIRAAVAAGWPDGPVDVLPAFKANPMLATRRILSEEGAGADIYSAGELDGALRAGVRPERISVNGGGKDREHLRRCVQAGVRITVEDVDEIDLIEQVAAEAQVRAKIRFRVKPAMPNLWRRTDFSQMSAPIDIGIQVYKSGVPREYLVEMGRRALALPHVELVGLHLHVGRHHPSAWYWDGAMRQYGRLVASLCRAWGGWQPQEIDIGGGFPSLRDPMNRETPRSEFLVTAAGYPLMVGLRGLGASSYHKVMGKAMPLLLSEPAPANPPPIETLVDAATQALRQELAAGGVATKGVRLQVEPGRWLYGNTAVHLTRVKAVKRQSEPVPYSWVLTDTTQFFLAGGAFEHNRYPIVAADRADAPPSLTADVVGQSCFADILATGCTLPAVAMGDVLALLETGAYQESSASNFNALPRPGTVLVNGSEADVIRRAETAQDLWARDVVPPRLAEQDSRP
ncbi:alanine racemase [Rubrivivax sp. JA1024]|nr:alanine racemase [Rubrivivax sp. JA1024]